MGETKNMNIAEDVSSIVYKEYEKLKPSSKPTVKSNSVSEWTVLAGIVTFNKVTMNYQKIAITTGVKAIPDADLKRSQGKIVHDCHAEITALRCFNIFLLDEINNLVNHKRVSKFVEQSGPGSFKWNDDWELALYISKLPCGDASMNHLRNSVEENVNDFAIDPDDPIQFVDPTNKTTLRGRINFRQRHVVRTKPGRYDSKITLSKSCSDKLCIKQVMGVLDSTCCSLLDNKVHLKYIIVPGISSQEKLLENEFRDRLKGSQMIKGFNFLSCSTPFIDDDIEGKEPALVSSVKIFMNNEKIMEQSIINGVKNGFYSKKNKPLRKNCQSVISRYSKWNLLKEILPSNHTLQEMSYLEFKESQTERNSLKDDIHMLLAPDGWIPTHEDDVEHPIPHI